MLRFKSLSLAEQSRKNSAEGRIIEAIEAALSALPKNMENPNKPYVFEAEVALYGALSKAHDQLKDQELLVLHGHTQSIQSVGWDSYTDQIATASEDGTVRLWSATSGKEIATLGDHHGRVNSVNFNPDGSLLVTTSKDRAAQLWDVISRDHVATLDGHERAVNFAMVSPQGTHIATASDGGTVRLWDVASGKCVATYQRGGTITSVLFSPDGKHLVTTSSDSSAQLWDINSNKVLTVLKDKRMRIDILKKTKHISEKGRRWIFVILGIPLAIWLIFWGQEIGLTQEGDFANLLLIVVVLVSMLFTMTFYVCRIIWNYLKLSLNDRRFWALTSAFSPLDGSRVLIGYGDGSVRLWDGASGRLLRKLEGHTHVVVSAVFSPDGTYAVTASYDGTARLWHAHSGELHTILPHEGPVNAAIFSPGGRQVITVSDDCTARLWDAASGECLATFRGHSSRVVTAMFDADGARVVTASHDRTARIWRTFPTTQSLIDEAQRLLPILKAQDRPLQNGVSVVE